MIRMTQNPFESWVVIKEKKIEENFEENFEKRIFFKKKTTLLCFKDNIITHCI